MAEFKKLSAVEAVDAVSDAASVLIEENGVIKRAPKSEVGGIKVASTAEVGQTIVVKAVDAAGNPTEWECADMASGNEYDAIISITGNQYMYPEITTDMVSSNSTEIINVVSKLKTQEPVNILIKYYYSYGGNVYIVQSPSFIRVQSDGTTNTGDNTLLIGMLLSSYYKDIYSVYMFFNTADGTCTSTAYKTLTIS